MKEINSKTTVIIDLFFRVISIPVSQRNRLFWLSSEDISFQTALGDEEKLSSTNV